MGELQPYRGAAPAASNVVARSGAAGVRISTDASVGNGILGNSIVASGALAIELGLDDVPPNDPCDPDVGPNNLHWGHSRARCSRSAPWPGCTDADADANRSVADESNRPEPPSCWAVRCPPLGALA